MNAAVIINRTKEEAESYSGILIRELQKRGAAIRIFQNKDYVREDLLGSDFIITLGGDGTILHTAGMLRGGGIPILGINTGHLGYLTELSRREQIPKAVKALFSGKFYRDRRAMLFGELSREDGEGMGRLSLNEILLSRSRGVGMLHFRIYCDGQMMYRYSADGIIIASPTGSTAYNLSAGGPIISPTAPVYIMTPICAHSMNARAVVMDDQRELEILVESENQLLSFDGEDTTELRPGDRIRIRKAREETVLGKLREGSFLEILRDKMAGV